MLHAFLSVAVIGLVLIMLIVLFTRVFVYLMEIRTSCSISLAKISEHERGKIVEAETMCSKKVGNFNWADVAQVLDALGGVVLKANLN